MDEFGSPTLLLLAGPGGCLGMRVSHGSRQRAEYDDLPGAMLASMFSTLILSSISCQVEIMTGRRVELIGNGSERIQVQDVSASQRTCLLEPWMVDPGCMALVSPDPEAASLGRGAEPMAGEWKRDIKTILAAHPLASAKCAGEGLVSIRQHETRPLLLQPHSILTLRCIPVRPSPPAAHFLCFPHVSLPALSATVNGGARA